MHRTVCIVVYPKSPKEIDRRPKQPPDLMARQGVIGGYKVPAQCSSFFESITN
jgi:hypothetical protein